MISNIRKTVTAAGVTFYPFVSWVLLVISAEVLYVLMQRRTQSFWWHLFNKRHLSGGPIQNNFPVHMYLSISDKCFGNFPLTIESKAKQKGSWHALCKAICLWMTKNTWVAWLFAWNGVVIWVWIPNSTYNNVRLSFAGRTPMFWKSHYEVIIFF